MVQRVAAYELAAINYSNLVRSIGLAVESSYLALVRSARQLEASMESVTVYEISLENERTKNRLGTSTLLNVLNVSDSLRNARFSRVSNYLNYVNALATFAYESGVLIEDASVAQVVDLSKLMDSTWAISVAP
jgi:outer membrane protein TolC